MQFELSWSVELGVRFVVGNRRGKYTENRVRTMKSKLINITVLTETSLAEWRTLKKHSFWSAISCTVIHKTRERKHCCIFHRQKKTSLYKHIISSTVYTDIPAVLVYITQSYAYEAGGSYESHVPTTTLAQNALNNTLFETNCSIMPTRQPANRHFVPGDKRRRQSVWFHCAGFSAFSKRNNVTRWKQSKNTS